MKRLVVLVSGFGSNLQAILNACADGRLPAQVAAVISNKADAFGLQRAIDAGVPGVAVPFYKELHLNRAGYDEVLADVISRYEPDLVILAGWMRILTPGFVQRFAGKMVNLHPALPGTFPGAHGIDDAFAAYQRGEVNKTGVMVHWVDEGVDTGPLIACEEVPIDLEDTLETLAKRVHAVEHRLIVDALAKVLA